MTCIPRHVSTRKHKLNCIQETVTISRGEGGIAVVRRTLQDVARTAGVSLATIDRVTNRRPGDHAERAEHIRTEVFVRDNVP